MSENLKTVSAKMSIEFYSRCPVCTKVKVIDHYDNINDIEEYKEIVFCCGKKFIVNIKRPTLLNPK